MKALIFIASALFVNFAHATYTTDIPGKAIQCAGPNVTVNINKDRSKITIIDAYDPGHPDEYSVKSGRQTDGDTFSAYDGVEISPDPETFVTLSFDDRGDSLVYRRDGEAPEAPIALKCR